jgi:hypothetical protein
MSELPIVIVCRNSRTNPNNMADIKLCREPCDVENQPRQLVAITLLVDSPLDILLRFQEPPYTLPPLSHLRHLSTFPDWRGIPTRKEYFLLIGLQPGLNHVTWCRGATTGMEVSFLPPPYGDWPTIYPHPIDSQHDLKYYHLSPTDQKYFLMTTKSSHLSPLSMHASLYKRPPSLAVYHVKGTVLSLQLMATLAVMGCGHLIPTTTSRMRVPHRLVDETFHPLQLCWKDGTIAH